MGNLTQEIFIKAQSQLGLISKRNRIVLKMQKLGSINLMQPLEWFSVGVGTQE